MVLEPEPWFVLRMVAMEIDGRLMRGGQQRGRNILPAESPNDSARLQGSVAYFQEIVVGFSGEIEKL